MRISEAWLREWVNPPVDLPTLADQLTRAGLEVDEVTPAAPPFSGVVVGRIVEVNAHPDADKLRVCSVDDGSDTRQQVVCGAPNAAAGLCVPFARPGAVLPSGSKITDATLRGVASAGMLCSARELGLSEQAAGLMTLPEDAPPGADLRSYLDVESDQVITLELTPNRGDCLSMEGVAREVATINRIGLVAPAINTTPPDLDDVVRVTVASEADCPHYAGRVIRGLRDDAVTPLWMQERLRRAGLRSIHPIVDVTNYVLLELGQPMHAFDLERLSGAISVRRATAGESLTLLDDQTVELDPSTLVIADESGPVAMAGVMGGAATAVEPGSRDIFLESACFAPLAVAGTGRRYKLHTDSLHRFERGVDPELQIRALERATMLLHDIAGGQAGPLVRVGDHAQRPRVVPLRQSHLTRLLGVEISAEQIQEILKRLGLSVSHEGAEVWQVKVPGYRYDISMEADLVEEVARIFGYDNLPARQQAVPMQLGISEEATVPLMRLAECLVDRGYHEVISYSFVESDLQQQLNPDVASVAVDNPIAEQFSVMRTTLWSSLLPVWRRQRQHRQGRIRLFETGSRFVLQGNEIKEEKMLSGVVSGSYEPEQWGSPARPVDLFDVKSDIEALLSLAGKRRAIKFRSEPHPALHPGQAAALMSDNQVVGRVGQLHPALATQLDLDETLYLFELDATFLRQSSVADFDRFSEYPAIRRDLALNVPTQLMLADVMTCLQAAQEPLLVEMRPFDVYQGKGLTEGFKSIALGLIFQDNSRTLTVDEVEKITLSLIERLNENLGVTIRG